MKSDTKNNQTDYKGNAEIKTIKANGKIYHNFILQEGLKGIEDKNIQYIIEVEGTFRIASLKPLTKKDIEKINFEEWNFRPFKEVLQEWSNKKEVQS